MALHCLYRPTYTDNSRVVSRSQSAEDEQSANQKQNNSFHCATLPLDPLLIAWFYVLYIITLPPKVCLQHTAILLLFAL
jgi:hypothetical protein